MNVSDKGLSLIKQFEGFRDRVYRDLAGKQTIGYGHLLKPGESFPKGVTEDEATALLHHDVEVAERAVNMMVRVTLTQGQFDALCSFTYNLGAETLERSTLLRVLNEKRYDYAADQFLAWDHADGVEVDGIRRRREAEREMFLDLRLEHCIV